ARHGEMRTTAPPQYAYDVRFFSVADGEHNIAVGGLIGVGQRDLGPAALVAEIEIKQAAVPLQDRGRSETRRWFEVGEHEAPPLLSNSEFSKFRRPNDPCRSCERVSCWRPATERSCLRWRGDWRLGGPRRESWRAPILHRKNRRNEVSHPRSSPTKLAPWQSWLRSNRISANSPS